MAKDSFLLYYEWEDNLSDLTNDQLGSLLRALFAYEKRSEQYTGSDPEVRMAFRFVKGTLDRNREKYDATVEKRREAGRKGGKKRKSGHKTGDKNLSEQAKKASAIKCLQEETKANKGKQSEAKQAVHVPVHVHVHDHVYESEGATPPTHARAKEQTDPRSQKVQWAENVTMTNEEHDKLVVAHGAADTALMIEHLSHYKAAHCKEYAGGDYRAIQSWVVNWLKEQKARDAKTGGKKAAAAPLPTAQMEFGSPEGQKQRIVESEVWMRRYLEEAREAEKTEREQESQRGKGEEDERKS